MPTTSIHSMLRGQAASVTAKTRVPSSRPIASKKPNMNASTSPKSWTSRTAWPHLPVPVNCIRRMAVLEQIQPAMNTIPAMPVITAFGFPCNNSPSTSSAGAQIIAMVPNVRLFTRDLLPLDLAAAETL